MNKQDYDRIIIDFHTKAFIDMSLKEGVRFAEENVEKLLSKFMNTFNSGLAENFLSGLNDTYPQLKDKVAQYPEHYWQSQQANDLLRSKLDQAMFNHFSLEGTTSNEARPHAGKSWEYGKDPELTVIGYIDSLFQVGRRDMIYKTIDYISQSVRSYNEQIAHAPEDLQEHMKKNILKLEHDIEFGMSDLSSSASTRHLDKSPEFKMVLSELQRNLGWDSVNKEKQTYLDGQQAALRVLNEKSSRKAEFRQQENKKHENMFQQGFYQEVADYLIRNLKAMDIPADSESYRKEFINKAKEVIPDYVRKVESIITSDNGTDFASYRMIFDKMRQSIEKNKWDETISVKDVQEIILKEIHALNAGAEQNHRTDIMITALAGIEPYTFNRKKRI